MAVANPKTSFLDTLASDVGVVEHLDGLEAAEQIVLTPYLALACSLLYMMGADGELEAQESSQLQAVLGGDQAVLSYALRYVQSVAVDQFFVTAAELLSVKDKWCILTNVCDALLSDGRADRAELALFSKMTTSWGIRDTQFEPYFKILALKNDKSILGKYTGVKDERQPMTPHFALAIALLYMLTADGAIEAHEVGQLEGVIGEFEGLQNVALKYVRSVKLKQFLDEASVLLQQEQKLYILMNVCDSMMSDGEVARLEDKLFLSVLTAFGFTEKTFARYFQVLETKNFKPFDTRGFKNHVNHERMTGNADEAGITFKNELLDVNDTGVKGLLEAANQGAWVGAVDGSEMSQFIARTMDGNIQSVSDDFENQDNVVKVGLNATDGLNLQKIGDGPASQNRQAIDSASPIDNLQKIDGAAQDVNRQQIESDGVDANRQLMESDQTRVNLQSIDVQASDQHRETLPPEVRLQNIYEVAEEVNHRLDRFEVAHSSFLQIGRTQKYTDDFVPIESESSDTNRQLLNASYARLGLEFSVFSTADSSSTSVSESAADTKSDIGPSDAPSDGGEISPLNAVSSSSATSAMPVDHAIVRFQRPRSGQANLGLYRARGFAYVQVVVAVFAIAFAAPIEKRSLFGRSTAGPLVAAPTAKPESIELHHVIESELLPVQTLTR